MVVYVDLSGVNFIIGVLVCDKFDNHFGFCTMNLQLRFACVDLELHTKFTPGGSESIFDVDRRVCQKTQVLPPLPEDKFLCSFSHIFAGLVPRVLFDIHIYIILSFCFH